MMDLGEYIKQQLKEQGRSQLWLAQKIGMNEKTLSGKLIRNSIAAEDLLSIAKWLDIDLNELKGSI